MALQPKNASGGLNFFEKGKLKKSNFVFVLIQFFVRSKIEQQLGSTETISHKSNCIRLHNWPVIKVTNKNRLTDIIVACRRKF